jgi:hypothetical protein
MAGSIPEPMFQVGLRSPGGQTHTLPYSDIFEYGWAYIVLYPYCIVFIFGRIHIQSEALGPYRIRIYLNTFKKYFSVSYFWPALPGGSEELQVAEVHGSERLGHQTSEK